MTVTKFLSFLLLALLAGCAGDPPVMSVQDTLLDRLQGSWEGDGPPGKIAITITGDGLRYEKSGEWFETTIILPTATDPQQLHATIRDCTPPARNIGAEVFALVKLEDDTLTLAVDDGADEPPASFEEASSVYVVRKIDTRGKTP